LFTRRSTESNAANHPSLNGSCQFRRTYQVEKEAISTRMTQ